MTRNVPLLLQILLWHGIIVHSLPRPKQALEPLSGFFLSNRGLAMPSPQFEPAFLAVVVASVVAIVGAIWFARYAHRIQDTTGKAYPVFTINAGLIVGLPLVVFLLAGLPVVLEWPALKGFNFKGGMTVRPEFMALWFALSFYTGSFIAEIVRAGIQAVSHGQTEAAAALGLRPNWTMRLVILPQALRVIIPPLVSQYLNLTKNSSLAIAIRLHGHRGDHRRDHLEPDRPGARVHVDRAQHLSADLAQHFVGHELVQQARRAGGTLGAPWLSRHKNTRRAPIRTCHRHRAPPGPSDG